MRLSSSVYCAIPLLAGLVQVAAQNGQNGTSNTAECSVDRHCGTAAPCCSEFFFCGVSPQHCLGGCNPLLSNTLTSCRPAPVCRDRTYNFGDVSRILTNATLYDGNSTEYDWVVDKGTIIPGSGELSLTLNEQNLGTRLSSTVYVHYGTISAEVKTSKWGGVVTAFITMSDIKDEIDWEWPGAKTNEGQSNFFWLGKVNYPSNDGATHDGISDTSVNYHNYTIDWQPETLRWLVDGEQVRVLQKRDTRDPETGLFRYPTTPSRVQLSLWAAGVPGFGEGTVEWAGGMIDWDHPDYVAAGQFWASVRSVSIRCSRDPAAAVPPDTISYVYGGNDTNTGLPTVIASNATTILNASPASYKMSHWTVAASAFGALIGAFLI